MSELEKNKTDYEKNLELAKERVAEYEEYGALGVSEPDGYKNWKALLLAEELLVEAEPFVGNYLCYLEIESKRKQEWLQKRRAMRGEKE